MNKTRANWGNANVRKPMQQTGARLHHYKLFYIPAWITVAHDLMDAAEIIIESQKEKHDNFWTDVRSGKDPERFNLVPAGLLYGLSFEALLKAILIKQGKIRSHQDLSGDYSHRLDEMVKKSGLKLDPQEMRMIFLLKDKVIWRAKYPTPLRSDDFYLKDDKGDLIMTERYEEYFNLHKVYAKILNFLHAENFFSDDLQALHDLAKETPTLYGRLYEAMEKGLNIEEFNLKIRDNDLQIDEVVKRLFVVST